MSNTISGAILAGGANRRFNGVTKANLLVGGKPVISRIIDVIGEIFNEIIIVTNTPGEFQAYDRFRITVDEVKDAGPLGGIHAALKAASNDSVFIIAGDMPFPDKILINKLIAKYLSTDCQILVPRVNGNIEPLHSIYHVSVLARLEEFISKGSDYSVRRFFDMVNVNYIKLDNTPNILTALTNINTPSDLESLTTNESE
jgi:molybdopterin-guanine dinucleotide biosynthesis protein A